jgi:hypothetical protein
MLGKIAYWVRCVAQELFRRQENLLLTVRAIVPGVEAHVFAGEVLDDLHERGCRHGFTWNRRHWHVTRRVGS